MVDIFRLRARAIAILLVASSAATIAGTDDPPPAAADAAQADAAGAPDAAAAAERSEIDAMVREALLDLSSRDPAIRVMFEQSHGYAVFHATKAGALLTAAGGRGVAVNSATGDRTYMRMASAGIALGAGLQGYTLALLFETPEAFDQFLKGQWDASASAVAAAGKDGANAVSSFVDGVAAYQVTNKGLMAQADLTGTRFWPNSELNAES